MGGGGGGKVAAPKPTPLVVEPEIEKQKLDVRRRLKGQFNKADTFRAFAAADTAPVERPGLLTTLGA